MNRLGLDGLGAAFRERQARSAPDAAGGPASRETDPDTKAGRFLADIIAVCRHHGLTIEHESSGRFIVEVCKGPGDIEQFRDAWIGKSLG